MSLLAIPQLASEIPGADADMNDGKARSNSIR